MAAVPLLDGVQEPAETPLWTSAAVTPATSLEATTISEEDDLAQSAQVVLHRASCCGDTLPVNKPDAGPALHACSVLEIEIDAALFVGDSNTDVECARAAGCAVVCVRDGYNHGTPAEQLGADGVIDSLSALI